MAKNKTREDGTKWCAQCKDWRPADLFSRPPKKFRVTICIPCGRRNMARWQMAGMVGRLPSEFTEAAD